MTKKFFSTLNYSSCNEDAYTELEALDIKPGDHVACITGSDSITLWGWQTHGILVGVGEACRDRCVPCQFTAGDRIGAGRR